MRGAIAAVKVAGLISGTSMDGLDVAVGDFAWDGDAVVLTPLHHGERPWPDDLRRRLRAVLPPASTTVDELAMLDTLVGQAAAEAVAGTDAELIASHGQTVFHWIEDGRALGTLQIGQPAWIVEATGLPVVSDLRARDVAAGGQGAPLAGTLDSLWLSSGAGALNLGGIANVTVVEAAASRPASTPARPTACSTSRRRPPRAASSTTTATARSRAPGPSTPSCSSGCSPTRTTRSRRRSRPAASASTPATSTASSPGPRLLATLTELTAVTVADALRPTASRRCSPPAAACATRP